MIPSYELSPEAFADLQDIARYTKRQWGEAQARKYRDQLEHCIEAIATGSDRFKNLSHIRNGLRSTRCEQHYIYCVIRNDRPALIVGVLHERMNLMARLAERLT